MEKKKSILVVDDDEASLQSLKSILHLEGYSVDTAETAGEAVEKYEARYYNLALLDLRLPDMKGTDLLLKMQEIRPKMVKIVVTGFPSFDTAVESLNRGADGYVMKPIDPEKLLKIIEGKLKEQEVDLYRFVIPH